MVTARLDPIHKRKRALILKWRRGVKVHTRFSIEDLGDGRERQTCRVCGVSVESSHCHPTYNSVVRRIIAYRAHGGVYGVCPTCSRKKAQERYPMPPHLALVKKAQP